MSDSLICVAVSIFPAKMSPDCFSTVITLFFEARRVFGHMSLFNELHNAFRGVDHAARGIGDELRAKLVNGRIALRLGTIRYEHRQRPSLLTRKTVSEYAFSSPNNASP